jgi:hypothetical protein
MITGKVSVLLFGKIEFLAIIFLGNLLSIWPDSFIANVLIFDAVYIRIVTLKVNGKMTAR